MTAKSEAGALNSDRYFKPVARVFRLPLAVRLFSLIGVIVLGAATAFMIAFAVIVFRGQWQVGLFMAAMACFMAAMTDYVWRDFRGKWGLRVVLGADAVTLDLPPWRSLIHRPPEQHLSVPYWDIAAIDSRFEAYGSLGMENMQRAYALHRKNGELIFLFEERAMNTGLASSYFTDVVNELLARAQVKLRDLGTVEGKGGLLAVWGTHSPDWATPALPRERARRLWRRAAATGALAMSVFLLVVVMMGAFRSG